MKRLKTNIYQDSAMRVAAGPILDALRSPSDGKRSETGPDDARGGLFFCRLRYPRLLLSLLSSMLLAPRLLAADPGPAPAQGRDFQDFKIVFERNIFDPNRRPQSAQGSRTESAPPTKVEGFSLIGTLISEEGAYAFFDGTEAKYRTVLKPTGAIADFKLAEIAPNHVRLNSASNTIELTMGMQLKKQDEGDWQLLVGPAPGGTSNVTSSAKEPNSGDSAGADSGADEVLKRLMQKREQELTK